MTLQCAVAAPFRHTRKTGMRKSELIYYYALDRKWMNTDQAVLLLKRAEEEGLLRQENGVYSPRFDPAAVTLPIGFRPSSSVFEHEDPVQELVGRIAKARGADETEIVAEMNRLIKETFDGHLQPPAAVVLLAKKYHVPFGEFLDRIRQNVKKDGR